MDTTSENQKIHTPPQPDLNNLNVPSAPAQEAAALEPEAQHATDQTQPRTATSQDLPDYESLTLPAEMTLPENALAEFKTLAQEMGLSVQHAQQLLDLEARFSQAGQQKAADERRDILDRWAEETRAMYGTKTGEEVARAIRAADAFGGPELRVLLEVTGLGNHPVIVRTFNEIGKRISEDVLPGGKPAAVQDKTFAEALYGKK